MKLPSMRYGSGDIRKTLSVFGGLNRRVSAGDGELIHCENLGANTYPALSPRAGRGIYKTYTNPGDIFEWNGHTVVVDGYNLLLDDKVIGNVTPGQKQFAVVNTRLVVWPDKVYYDMESEVFMKMDAGVVSDSADPSAYTHNTLTLGENNVHDHGNEQFTTAQYVYSNQQNIGDVYAKTYSSLSWDGSAWVGADETETRIQDGWEGKFIKLRANAVAGVYNLNTRETETVTVISPSVTAVFEARAYTEDKDELCAEIVSVTSKMVNLPPETIYSWDVKFRVISSADDSDRPLSEVFEVGDWVTLEGVPGTKTSKEYKITGIDDESRTLSFPDNSFLLFGNYYYKLTEEQETDWILRQYTGTYPGGEVDGTVIPASFAIYGFRLPPLPNGSVLFADNAVPGNDIYAVTLKAWNCKTGTVITVKSEVIESGYYEGGFEPTEEYQEYTLIQGAGLINWSVEVKKGAPGMDYICSHNNRLYGVSNSANVLNEDGSRNEEYKTRIIYVSELGIPNHFNTFEGVDTDSYQVAEASNGDFTGCISYGEQVLFFKEHKVLKFYGDYPSNMGYSYDDIEGVKQGCHKSMVIANEVLYYMGRAGMCAYTGSVPQIISYKLDREYDDVICGTDGKKILMCGKYGDEREVLSYNIAEGIWLREDNAEVKAMALIDSRVHMLVDNKELIDGGGEEKVNWSAEFHPFTEDTFERKRYKYISVRAELEAGSVIRVCAKIGDGEYETWYTAENSGWQTMTVPMPLMRVDRVSLKIEGEGKAIVRDIQRQYQKGSER